MNDFGRLINDTNNKFRELDATRKSKEKRIRDISDILDAVKMLKELNPIQEKYDHTFFKGAKEKYGKEHADELEQIKKAKRLLYKLNVTLPINGKTLKAESTKLRGEVESLMPELESMKAELDQQMKIRSHIRKVMPSLLALKTKDGKQSFEDVSEEVQNAKELRELLEESVEGVLRYDPDLEPKQQQPVQDQQQEKQRKQRQQQPGGR